MPMDRALGWMLTVVLACACACGAAAEPDRRPAPAREPPRAAAALPIAVHGCAGLTGGTAAPPGDGRTRAAEDGPRCWRRSDSPPLVIWLAGEQPGGAPAVFVDDVPADGVEIDADDDGTRIVLRELPPAARRVVVVHADGRRASLALEPEPPAFVAAKRELDGLLAAGRPLLEVRARLSELRAGLEPVAQHRLDCFAAKLAFAARDWPFARDTLQRLGRAEVVGADRACVALLHIEAGYHAIMREPDYAQALAHLQAARADPLHLQATVNADYFTGVLELRLGRLDDALELLAHAAALARRTGLDTEYAAAVVEQASVLAELGRFDEAKALAEQAEAALPPDHPKQVDIRGNAAWVQILRREDDPSLADPSPTLRELVRHYEREGSSRVDGVRLNLAIAASQSGDLDAAAAALDRVDRRALKDPAEQVFAELVAARIVEARGEPALARERLERARLLAELGSDERLALRARLARAELELSLHDRQAARRELEQADLIEDRLALGIAPQAGRSTFSSAHRRDRARYVELLLELGDRSAALCTVLGARARHLRSLRSRGDQAQAGHRVRQGELLLQHGDRRRALAERAAESWMLPADELAELRRRSERELAELDALLAEAMALGERQSLPWSCAAVRSPSSDDALLTMYPSTTAGRWWWLLDRAGTVAVIDVEHGGASEAADPRRAAAEAVTTLAAEGRLEGLRTLTVVPIGALNTVDFHELPLLQPLEVRYGVGLGPPPRPALVVSAVAVLVGASQNLREPRREAASVETALRGAGWPVSGPWTPQAEPQPTLLHYAGHGRHGGITGWGSHLVLADGELRPAQIIAHGRSPAIVVLGACDAGTHDPGLIDGGMNVATAFVLAGARLVIAPHDSVDDHDARALAEQLYADPPAPADPARLAATLQARLAAAQRGDPRFLRWRVWVP